VIVAELGLTPVTTPVDRFTAAIVESLLIQVPPVGISLNAVVEPTQTFIAPVIPPGIEFTVTTAVAEQPPEL
jgi:hypothetical protein